MIKEEDWHEQRKGDVIKEDPGMIVDVVGGREARGARECKREKRRKKQRSGVRIHTKTQSRCEG